MNPVKQYPILQSGFISLTNTGMLTPERINQSFSSAILGKEVDNSMEEYFYSRDVELLITDWKNDSSVMKRFDFREKIIQTAFRCFATPNIRYWIEMQNLRPTLGTLHKEFLLDTLMYIAVDDPRKIECLQWCRLLFPESGGSLTFKELTDLANKSSIRTDTRFGPLYDTPVFLQQWVARKDGYVDLLKSLHAIFGRRGSAGAHQSR